MWNESLYKLYFIDKRKFNDYAREGLEYLIEKNDLLKR